MTGGKKMFSKYTYTRKVDRLTRHYRPMYNQIASPRSMRGFFINATSKSQTNNPEFHSRQITANYERDNSDGKTF